MSWLVALDIDGTLIDTRPSFDRIVRELSGATVAELQRFRDTGGFNDDWQLTRALVSWIGAGRPDIVERCQGVDDVISWCAHDPGDLAPRCQALYRGGWWRDEKVLLSGDRLQALSERVATAACTGRDAWELARAEELLGFTFPEATTMEHARKPDPQALLRLVGDVHDRVVLIGDTQADRLTVQAARRMRRDVTFEFVFANHELPAARFVDAVVEGEDIDVVARRFCET
jgi:phosphoglycolate phosphatase-like HAD superfamily hydrolase